MVLITLWATGKAGASHDDVCPAAALLARKGQETAFRDIGQAVASIVSGDHTPRVQSWFYRRWRSTVLQIRFVT
jgi:hypothetical protein